jgi:hypothetical protein
VERLTGRVYVVQADAVVYQYAVNQGMTSRTHANGQAMCGAYSGGVELDAIGEIAGQLEKGELYLLVRYYGGMMVRPMALMHQ